MPGLESLISLFYPHLDTLFDYIPEQALIVTVNPDELEKVVLETEERIISNYNSSRDERIKRRISGSNNSKIC